MHVSDDLYLGGFYPAGLTLGKTGSANPTLQQGVGPMGRVVFKNIIPLTLATANLAALAAPTAQAPLAIAAGTGLTLGVAPDGSGAAVVVFDTPRCGSLTSTANLSGINFLWTGYDQYGNKQTQLMAGPNNNTVNTLKAFASVLSVVPQGTSASTVSAGTSDIFGLPFVCVDAGYIVSVRWNNVLAQNTGTLTIADATSPATSSTGDTRGTFAQAGGASNGTRRLVICQHLDGTQCGQGATQLALLGVTPA